MRLFYLFIVAFVLVAWGAEWLTGFWEPHAPGFLPLTWLALFLGSAVSVLWLFALVIRAMPSRIEALLALGLGVPLLFWGGAFEFLSAARASSLMMPDLIAGCAVLFVVGMRQYDAVLRRPRSARGLQRT